MDLPYELVEFLILIVVVGWFTPVVAALLKIATMSTKEVQP